MSHTETEERPLGNGEVYYSGLPPEKAIATILDHPKLVAQSFEPDFKPGDTVDLQGEKIAELKKDRLTLLRELHITNAEEALENPALYLREAVIGFAQVCPSRIKLRQHISDLSRATETLATVRYMERPDGTEYATKDIEMDIIYRADEDDEFYPESFWVKTEFQANMQHEPVSYRFYTDGDEFSVEQQVYRRGEMYYEEVADEFDSRSLLQALVVKMLWSERHIDPKDDVVARSLLKRSG